MASTPLIDEHEAASSLETHFDDAEPVWAALNHQPDQYRVPLLLQIEARYTIDELYVHVALPAGTLSLTLFQPSVPGIHTFHWHVLRH